MDGLLSGSNNNNNNNNIPICAVQVTSASSNANANTNHNNNVVITGTNVINSCNQYVNSLSNMPISTTTSFSATTTTTNIATTNTTTTSEDTEMRHRFRVVKLVSSQPYTRGRWTCFDYNDENQNTINIAKHAPANKILANGHTENSQLNDHSCNTANNNGSDQSEVAIDNKIEQAMDLVKSHLMFAVREEVDVLRERIKELENDNQILIAHASPETLALLSNRSTSTNQNID